MIELSMGNRNKWEFEYTAAKLADGAKMQLEFRRSRVEWWQAEKNKIMQEIKDVGLEVNESISSSISNSYGHEPSILVRTDLQKKLTECHGKIQSHQQAVDEYEGWIQVLLANPENRLKLTQADWLYFFAKH